jgi:septum formation protein
MFSRQILMNSKRRGKTRLIGDGKEVAVILPATLPLILASRSPRRRELLADAGYQFEVLLPDDGAEDTRLPNESPIDYVQRLAIQKSQNVAQKIAQGTVIGCDTVAVCGGQILEKPIDRNDARRMLELLRGKQHSVLSGLCILVKRGQLDTKIRTSVERTQLEMLPISEEMLETYLDGGNWQGKAGAFGYQDGNDWITIIEGSESNVVGLPMEKLTVLLQDDRKIGI